MKNLIKIVAILVARVTFPFYQSLGETAWGRFNERKNQVSRQFDPSFRYGGYEIIVVVKLPPIVINTPRKNRPDVFHRVEV